MPDDIIVKQLNDLILWEPNPRSITKDRYKRLKDSIKKQGFHDVLKLAADGRTVLGGNHRLRALQDLGYKEANCIVTKAETDAEKFEIAITDNMQYAEYEKDALAELVYKLDIPIEDVAPLEVDFAPPIPLLDLLKEVGPNFDEEEEKPRKSREIVCPDCGTVIQA